MVLTTSTAPPSIQASIHGILYSNMRKLFLLVLVILASLSVSAQDKKVSAKDRKKIDLYSGDAEYRSAEGNYYRALPRYLKLIQIDSTEEFYWFEAGICYIYTDDKEKAITFLEKVYDEDPEVKDIQYFLGRAYHINYRFDTAITLFKSYLAKGHPSEQKRKSAQNYIKYCENAKQLVSHPVRAFIRNLGPVLNTGASEYAPVITADESEIIYTYRGQLSTGGLMNDKFKADTNGEYYEDIFISHKLGDSWLAPEPISE